MNNVVRVDWRPSNTDSFYFTFKDWYSDQRGSEITAGPAKWGFFNTHYLNTDRGVSMNYTKIIRLQPRPRHRRRHPSADRAVLSPDRRRLEPDQSRHGRLHRRAVLSEPEPSERDPEGELQREQPAELHLRQPSGRPGRGVAVVASHEPDLDSRRPLDEGGVLPRAVPQLRRQRRCRRRSLGRTVQLQRRQKQSVRHQPHVRERAARFLPELHRNRRVLRGPRPPHRSRSSTCRTRGAQTGG